MKRTSTRRAEKRDYWVFDKDGQHYGPMPKNQAEPFAKQLSGSSVFQANSLKEAGEMWLAEGRKKARGMA